MLDTSFLIRLLKEDDPLHTNAKSYYQYLLENNFVLYVSTVAVAEYCVKGELDGTFQSDMSGTFGPLLSC